MKHILIVKALLIKSICGFILWTTLLTPYIIFVIGVDGSQYLRWILMQLIIVPIIAPIVFGITERILVKCFSHKEKEEING